MVTDPNLFADLESRGLIHDSTDSEALQTRLREGPITVYYGVDPTATSLHVGNLIGLLTLRRFQEAGHRPIPLAGGATGMIGDPSGKSTERVLLDDDGLAANLAGMIPLLGQFVDFDDSSPSGGKLLDNRAWTVSVSLLDFLRDIGKHMTINQMAAKESVKTRMAGVDGISYTEFSYMLLQANDYLWLYENEGCELQIGGSDQWGNISLGIDLIRRKTGGKAHGLTWPLLLQRDGTKYGKTSAGDTVWLGADHMSPYRFYQAWIQSDDADQRRLLSQLTFLPVEEVDEIVARHAEAPHQREAQRRLAVELTTIVHGKDSAEAATAASTVVFGGTSADLDVSTFETLAGEIPTIRVDRSRLDESGNLIGILVDAGVGSSRSEVGRLLKQNGISLNDDKVTVDTTVSRSFLSHDRFCLVRRGKKSVHLLVFDDAESPNT